MIFFFLVRDDKQNHITNLITNMLYTRKTDCPVSGKHVFKKTSNLLNVQKLDPASRQKVFIKYRWSFEERKDVPQGNSTV